MAYFLLATGGKLNLAGGGSLLLSGTLFRTGQVGETNISANDALSQVQGVAIAPAPVAELIIGANNATTKSGVVILASTAQMQANGVDGFIAASGTGLVTAFTAETLADAVNALVTGQGLISATAESANTFINAVHATASPSGIAFVSASFAEALASAVDAAVQAFGTGLTIAQTAQLQIGALDALSQAQGTGNALTLTADLTAQALFANASADGVVNIQAIAGQLHINADDAIALRDGVIPNFIPYQPIALRIVRNPLTTANLTWQDGMDTYEVIIQQANNQRAEFNNVSTVPSNTQQATLPVSASDTVAFRLIPVGETGLKGKTSYIVYSAPPDNIT